VRIVLVDDQPLVRNGIASLLQARGHEVVGEAGDGQEGLALVRRTRPDLVLMDLRMPVMEGLEATRLLKAEFPHIKVVILTVSDDERDLVDAVKSGAHGYLLKDLEADGFFEAIDAVGHGESVIPPRLARHLWAEFGRMAVREQDLPAEDRPLTDREWEVLRLVAAGQTNREIADALSISENTVKFHMGGILDKLHLRNRAEVATWAAEHRHRHEPPSPRPTGEPPPNG
jgi:DNA-binding NarL/FixJ family response regulator